MPRRYHHRHRPAAVLLLSLLMMAAITASTIGISVLITSDFDQTRATEQFIRATLAADAGIERGLAIVAAGRKESSVQDTLAAASPAGSIQVQGTQSTVTQHAESTTVTPPLTIPPQASLPIDVFKDVAGNVPVSIALTGATYTGSGQVGLVVQWTAINNNGSSGQGRQVINGADASEVTTIDLRNVYTESSNDPLPFIGSNVIGYRIRLSNTTNYPIANLLVTPKDSNDQVMPLYSTIKLTADGTAGDATAHKEVTTLWQQPASKIFSYVLFTEGDIKPEP